MHELSIALSVTEGVLEESRRRGGLRISGVVLTVGPLAGVDEAALHFAWTAATDGTPLAGSRLVIEKTHVTAMCPQCKEERTPESLQRFFCAECGTPMPELVSGNDLEIRALEVEE